MVTTLSVMQFGVESFDREDSTAAMSKVEVVEARVLNHVGQRSLDWPCLSF